MHAHRELWNEYELDSLSHAAEQAHTRLDEAVKKILKAKATGLFGIGVKLAALPATIFLDGTENHDPEDYIPAIASVLDDINRLIGTDFVGVEEEYAEDDEEA